MVTSFHKLFPHMTDGGLYVIEDVQTAFWPHFGGSEVNGAETMQLATEILFNLNHAEINAVQPEREPGPLVQSVLSFRAYHNMFVVEKGDNSEPSNAKYVLTNPHAARAVHSIEVQLQETPTAAGYANLATIYLAAGDTERASRIANDALARWPDATQLLLLILQLPDAQDPKIRRDCFRRLIDLEPRNEDMKTGFQTADAEVNAGPK